ncbi:hypothetical protein ACH414_28100 [Streptomyces sp. NPDC020422]|uniref:hypothetical protein n=1 Tax=unclassified Streptomyces TaxID=2593676 RepID=UPI0037009620
MTKDQTGRLIGASFGLFFVQANAGALPTRFAAPLRGLAVAAFVALVVFGRRRATAAPAGEAPAGEAPVSRFGRRYWLVVAAEVVALAAGLLVISRVLHAPHAAVGWIAFVVGVHFFGLAAAWRRPRLHALGAALTACGAAGLALAAATASPAVIATVAGILPGVLLLASVWRSDRAREAAVVGA